jgi:aspartyl-tRNA(Asn)/glutamyl-tRNA(Gln) amidotransferase subunit A
MSDAADLGVAAAAAALRSGALQARTLTDACLRRIEARNPALHAFIAVTATEARAMAADSAQRLSGGAARSPLEGIPFALKDNIDQRGVASTNGLAHGPVAVRDARVVERLRAAGAVLVGKLNMHECALGATNRNPHWGDAQNPLRAGFTPGGSSGGAAAAVAACLVPAALGTDTLGSVRLPAAYCGVVGFKPSFGRLSTDGVLPLSPALDHVGPLARSVEDAALVFAALDEAPQSALPSPPAALRLGLLANERSVRCEPAALEAFRRALARLRACGVAVETLELDDFDPEAVRRAGLLVVEAEGAAALAGRGSAWSLPSAPVVAMLEYGRRLAPERLARAREAVRRCGEAYAALAVHVDAIVSLTAPQCAFTFEAVEPANQASLCAPANFAGAPSISLPIADGVGLPYGLLLTAAPGRDAALLAVARRVEALLGGA